MTITNQKPPLHNLLQTPVSNAPRYTLHAHQIPRQKPPLAATLNTLRLISFYFYLISSQKTGHGFYKNMQNEPNLNISKNTLTIELEMTYLTMDTWYCGKNEPKTNPNEANLKPIQTHFKPNSDAQIPIQKSPPCGYNPTKRKFHIHKEKKNVPKNPHRILEHLNHGRHLL